MNVIRIALIFALVAQPAVAASQQYELDEVVVTASRVDEKLSETAATVNVVSEEEIEAVKYKNPDELLRRIPGVYSHNFSGESELSSIRVPTHFTNPYTLLLIDGVPVSGYGTGSSGNFRELNANNIKRVEVVKGPSSALYGSNAIGGVINIITKDPSSEPEIRVWQEVADYSQFRGGISGSGSSEKLSITADLSYIDADYWRQYAAGSKYSGSAKLQYLPVDDGLFTFKTDYIYFDNESPGSLDESDFLADWQQSYHTFAYTKLEKIAPLASYTHYFDNAEIKGTLLIRSLDEESIPHYGIRQQGFATYVGQFVESETLDVGGQLLYSRELDFLRSKVIVGVDAERGKTETQQFDLNVVFDSALNKFVSFTNVGLEDDFDITTKLNAPYFQYEFSPIEKLKLSVGGRYDDVTYEVESGVDPTKEGDKDFSQFTSKFGAVYQFSPTLNAYFNYAEGFVVPTTSQLLTSSWANINLQPEKAESYEVGVRSALFDKRLDIDAALYWMDIRDKIITRDITSFTREYVNAGETSQKGLEVNGCYLFNDAVSLAFAYTYAVNKYEIFTNGTDNFSGNDLPRSPRHRFNVRLNVMPMENFDVELEMDSVSSQYTDDGNTAEYSRPTLVNLRMTYDWHDWSFWAHIENLTDEVYASYVSYSSRDATSTFFPGNPLTIFAGVSYRWKGGQ